MYCVKRQSQIKKMDRKKSLTPSNEMLFDRMAAEASRAVVYRDTVLEVDALLKDLLDLNATYYSSQTLEIIRQRIRAQLGDAGLIIE